MPDKIARFDMYTLVGVRMTCTAQVCTPPPNSEKFASPVPIHGLPAPEKSGAIEGVGTK